MTAARLIELLAAHIEAHGNVGGIGISIPCPTSQTSNASRTDRADREFLVATFNSLVDLVVTLINCPGNERALAGVRAELEIARQRFEREAS